MSSRQSAARYGLITNRYSSHMKKCSTRGFTLIELMVTLAIAGILIAIATPSFVQMATRNRITTYANTFIGSLNYARSEAIRLGVPVSVCSTTDNTSCAGANSWSSGWMVFVNTNNDSPAVVSGASEPVLKVYEALATDYTLASGTFTTDVTFARDGSAQSGGVFAVCHNSDTVGARAIILTRLRPRIGADTDGNRIPNTDTGDIANCTAP
jgi:type IV fimbrial biogenesis protein FimT